MTPDAVPIRAGARTFAGLFLVTLSTLTYQLLLTRTFSVTMGSVVARTAMVVLRTVTWPRISSRGRTRMNTDHDPKPRKNTDEHGSRSYCVKHPL